VTLNGLDPGRVLQILLTAHLAVLSTCRPYFSESQYWVPELLAVLPLPAAGDRLNKEPYAAICSLFIYFLLQAQQLFV
jgi:hypothetical protein